MKYHDFGERFLQAFQNRLSPNDKGPSLRYILAEGENMQALFYLEQKYGNARRLDQNVNVAL